MQQMNTLGSIKYKDMFTKVSACPSRSAVRNLFLVVFVVGNCFVWWVKAESRVRVGRSQTSLSSLVILSLASQGGSSVLKFPIYSYNFEIEF